MSLSEHNVLGDHRGKWVAIESNKNAPFEAKGVFYIYGTQPDVPRGNHSYYKTKQYFFLYLFSFLTRIAKVQKYANG
ncbi:MULTISPECIES: WxcM-like domain-containing protein [Marinomonas]|uniref:WxcM-like domain-containing protein n=1 Tax=Marinomonas rhodophyticola TaxID=2992803 RepID=A0ABT3KKB2_9GAMM|nr:WxcM-like domain-containing protein [Marinomonas sp. KJ51-3]MCW4631002.1 WxcM-like domain-containing protein [Marinomonas sp. KJ51-3]